MAKDDMDIVSAVRAALADKVGQERFELWFGSGAKLAYADAVLRVGAPSRFFADWMRANFRKQIESAAAEVLGLCPEVTFHVDAGAQTASADEATPPTERQPQQRQRRREPQTRVIRTVDAAQPTAVAAGVVPARRKLATLESFVTGESNRLALASAQMAVRQPGQLSPLIFHGPTSVGKTHLLEGILAASRRTAVRLTAVYLSAEQFTSYFLEALRGSGLPSFRRKYRSAALLILDDLQFLVGKRATQVELLHTIDSFLREGRQLVFAADRSPAELAELGPELTTRLTSGMVCRIETPDYATRLGIVAHMAQRMKLEVPREVQEYVAGRLTNHARELSGALCRLQAVSQAWGQRISRAMAEEALADLLGHNGRVVRLADIEKAVCETFGLEPASLQADTKGKRISHPRMLAMWLARKHTRAALSEIGSYFGHRAHSTVVAAQKRVDDWMASGRPLELADGRWRAEDAIRQVERCLVAG